MTDSVDTHVAARYEIRERLGKGAYGIVWRAVDKTNGEVVAVKKIFDAFRNITDAQRTFREIMYLQAFSDHPNVVTLLNVLKADSDKDFYLVFGHMDTDLHVVIRGKLLLDVHIRWVMYQLLLALACMHSGEVIHRDLKPSNILLNDNCDVRLCDFGLARSVAVHMSHGDEVDPTMTDYVATRWYRAPEILLGSHKYTTYADMWSVGCILGEMLIGKPLFTGSSSLNQVDVILRCLGRPSSADIAAMQSPYADSTISRMHIKPGPSIESLLYGAPADGVDLVKRLLVANPHRRLSALDALKHPYVSEFFDSKDVRLLPRAVVTPIDDNTRLTIDDYRIHLYKEVAARCEVIATHRAMTAAKERALHTPRIQTAQAEAGRPAVLMEKEKALAAQKAAVGAALSQPPAMAPPVPAPAPAAPAPAAVGAPLVRNESLARTNAGYGGHSQGMRAASVPVVHTHTSVSSVSAASPPVHNGHILHSGSFSQLPTGGQSTVAPALGGHVQSSSSATTVAAQEALIPGMNKLGRRESVPTSISKGNIQGSASNHLGTLPNSVTGRVGSTAAHAMRNASHIFGASQHYTPPGSKSTATTTTPAPGIGSNGGGASVAGDNRHARPSSQWRSVPPGYGKTGLADMSGSAFGNASGTGARAGSQHGYLTSTQYKELTRPW